MAKLIVDSNAWASGQMGSKLWLCEEIEKLFASRRDMVIWNYGSWYSMIGFLLKTRDRLDLKKFYGFDTDGQALETGDLLNDYWIWKNHQEGVAFEFFNEDINGIVPQERTDLIPPDLIINTSVEHIEGNQWWESIPEGQWVALQCTDMPHEDHHHTCESEEDLLKKFALSEVHFCDRLFFDYEGPSSFHRFMCIGRK